MQKIAFGKIMYDLLLEITYLLLIIYSLLIEFELKKVNLLIN